jgi:TatA/E family protein of Tat protein translocase
MLPHFGPMELAIILVIMLMIFGAGKLPEVGHALGRGIKEFKKGTADEAKEVTAGTATTVPPAAPTPTAQPVPTAPLGSVPPTAPVPGATPVPSRYCPKCGASSATDTRFCGSCGASLPTAAA